MICFIPINHVLIVAALKIINHQGNEINKKDAFIGIKRFKELAPTYIIYDFITSLSYVIIVIFIFNTSTRAGQISQIDLVNMKYYLGRLIQDFLFNHSSLFLLFLSTLCWRVTY